MSTTSLELSRSYASFSGVDIRVVIEGQNLGTLQAISYAIQREKAPIYVMGRVDPLSFSRGKRGIAGTLITLMLDRHLLYQLPFADLKFIADVDELWASTSNLNSAALDPAGGLADINLPAQQLDPSNLAAAYREANAWYVDQLPPFDAVIIAQNEYGNAAQMRIYGIEILNEGAGFSIDDIVIESQMTYVCRTILPWQAMGRWQNGTYVTPAPAVTF